MCAHRRYPRGGGKERALRVPARLEGIDERMHKIFVALSKEGLSGKFTESRKGGIMLFIF